MQMNTDFQIDRLVRISLIVAVTYLSFILLHPLYSVLAWAFILAVALYPIFLWLNKRLWNRSAISATVITSLSLLLIVGTMVMLSNNVVETLSSVISKVRSGEQIIPQPPAGIQQWPLVGEGIHQAWSAVSANASEAVAKYAKYFLNFSTMMLTKVVNKGLDLLLFMISVILSGYLMTQGKHIMTVLRKFADKVALERGADLINLMKETIQNVSRGVIGVALFQTIIFGLLLLIASVPGAGILSFFALILCIVQAGLILLAIPIIIWLFYAKSFIFALIISILLVFDTILDGILKPMVLSRGLSTPMMVIFIGLIGGLLVYGLIGVFIGPVILAIFYDMIRHWLKS
jgi:predicted PurR-regulated permease PerM